MAGSNPFSIMNILDQEDLSNAEPCVQELHKRVEAALETCQPVHVTREDGQKLNEIMARSKARGDPATVPQNRQTTTTQATSKTPPKTPLELLDRALDAHVEQCRRDPAYEMEEVPIPAGDHFSVMTWYNAQLAGYDEAALDPKILEESYARVKGVKPIKTKKDMNKFKDQVKWLEARYMDPSITDRDELLSYHKYNSALSFGRSSSTPSVPKQPGNGSPNSNNAEQQDVGAQIVPDDADNTMMDTST